MLAMRLLFYRRGAEAQSLFVRCFDKQQCRVRRAHREPSFCRLVKVRMAHLRAASFVIASAVKQSLEYLRCVYGFTAGALRRRVFLCVASINSNVGCAVRTASLHFAHWLRCAWRTYVHFIDSSD